MDIFDLAIKLGLADGVSGGLMMIANQFTSLRVNIRSTQSVLQSFQAALGASWEWHAGRKMLRGMRDVIGAGGELLDHQALMPAAGWKQAEAAQMTAAAYRATVRLGESREKRAGRWPSKNLSACWRESRRRSRPACGRRSSVAR